MTRLLHEPSHWITPLLNEHEKVVAGELAPLEFLCRDHTEMSLIVSNWNDMIEQAPKGSLVREDILK